MIRSAKHQNEGSLAIPSTGNWKWSLDVLWDDLEKKADVMAGKYHSLKCDPYMARFEQAAKNDKWEPWTVL